MQQTIRWEEYGGDKRSQTRATDEVFGEANLATPLATGPTGIEESDPILVDLSTSCTRDVAVAKLLGWMRGPIRRRYIDLTEDGIPIEQMVYLHALEHPLAEHLTAHRAGAQKRLSEAFEAGASEDVMDVHLAEVKQRDDTIYKAAQYMRDIDDELAKGADSTLQLDLRTTGQTEELHITLSSLNQWTKPKYGIAVVEENPLTNTSGAHSESSIPMKKVESSFDEAMLSRSQETVYASFGFLMAAYAAGNPDCVIGERLDALSIAETIVEQLETNLKHPIYGQSAETMRKTFARAIRAMEGRLKLADSDHQSYLKKLIADCQESQKKT